MKKKYENLIVGILFLGMFALILWLPGLLITSLPIWVVGTCAFGNYTNENCFAEKLLKKGDSAIAIISTTFAEPSKFMSAASN